ncbi:hypothetical protein J6590_027949 [Homalodisca vitripennis]|nr:hypothetical protein J6590_027949 [Homalodisca vitripennis]
MRCNKSGRPVDQPSPSAGVDREGGGEDGKEASQRSNKRGDPDMHFGYWKYDNPTNADYMSFT